MLQYVLVLVFCLFVFNLSVVASDSDAPPKMGAKTYTYYWFVLFNDFQEFYDVHRVVIEDFADKDYDGMYTGNCYVSGDGVRDEKFLGNGDDTYYLGGAGGTTVPDCIDNGQKPEQGLIRPNSRNLCLYDAIEQNGQLYDKDDTHE